MHEGVGERVGESVGQGSSWVRRSVGGKVETRDELILESQKLAKVYQTPQDTSSNRKLNPAKVFQAYLWMGLGGIGDGRVKTTFFLFSPNSG